LPSVRPTFSSPAAGILPSFVTSMWTRSPTRRFHAPTTRRAGRSSRATWPSIASQHPVDRPRDGCPQITDSSGPHRRSTRTLMIASHYAARVYALDCCGALTNVGQAGRPRDLGSARPAVPLRGHRDLDRLRLDRNGPFINTQRPPSSDRFLTTEPTVDHETPRH